MLFKKRVETDDEFVSKIRKYTILPRKIHISLFIFAAAFYVLTTLTLVLIIKMITVFSKEANHILLGVGLGFFFGFIQILTLALAIRYTNLGIFHLKDKRVYQLLLKYYDQLNPTGENKK